MLITLSACQSKEEAELLNRSKEFAKEYVKEEKDIEMVVEKAKFTSAEGMPTIFVDGYSKDEVDVDRCRVAFAAATMSVPFEENGKVTQHPAVWWKATRRVLQNLAQQIDLTRIGAISVDRTGTVLGVDGRPVGPAQMYNSRARADIVRAIAAVLRRSRLPAAPPQRSRGPELSDRDPARTAD